jgi:hypothetical protein
MNPPIMLVIAVHVVEGLMAALLFMYRDRKEKRK